MSHGRGPSWNARVAAAWVSCQLFVLATEVEGGTPSLFPGGMRGAAVGRRSGGGVGGSCAYVGAQAAAATAATAATATTAATGQWRPSPPSTPPSTPPSSPPSTPPSTR
jgi:hypothetical protein